MKPIKSKVGLRVLAGGLLWLLALGALTAQTKIGDLYYNLNATDQTATVTRVFYNGAYIKYSGDIVIPESVDYNGTTYAVTSIDDYAFQDCTGLTSIEIPASVTEIGLSAFNGCSSLQQVKIADRTTILNFPASLERDEQDYDTYYIFCHVFDSCPIRTLYMGGNIRCYGETTYLGGYETSPFGGMTTLETVIIGNSVTKIGDYAFYGCTGLTPVTIPNSVTSIDYAAFSGCTGLTSVMIPNSVTSIGKYAFHGCTGLTSVTIPNSVTSIDYAAFSGCTGLTSVTIPNSVTYIDYAAFSGCTGLTSVTIPNSVTYIGEDAFSGCTGLTAINVDESNTKYSSVDGVLYNKAKTSLLQWPGGKMEVNIPSSVTSIVDYAFAGCTGLTSIEIPASVDTVDSYAFEGCTGLTHVTIADRRTAFKSFGSSVFASCPIRTLYLGGNVGGYVWASPFYGLPTLETVTIGPLVSDIGYYSPFGSCTGLTAIDVDERNEVICSVDGVLYNKAKTSLLQWPGGKTEVNLPSSVTEIGMGAFDGCTGLTSIEIPASVEMVGDLAFTGCTGLQSVKIADRETTLKFGYSVFNGTVKDGRFYNISQCPIRSLYVGGNISYDVDGSFCYDCARFLFDSVLESVTFGPMVTKIGYYAFARCTGLTSVTIPNSVTEIGGSAFGACTGLKDMVLGESVAYIRNGAFYNCINLISMTSKAVVPAECEDDVFYNVSKTQCELIVPEVSVEFYKRAPGWKDFARVTGQDLSDRIYVTALRLDPGQASLRVGKGLQLRAVVTPDSATNQTLTWSSSNKGVAMVDNDGYVVAVSAGEAVVTARTTDGSNLSATCTVTVTAAGSGGSGDDGGDDGPGSGDDGPGGGGDDDGDKILVETISVSTGGASTELQAGGTLQLSAVITPSNATNQAVTWSSSDKKVATVDNDGYVVALAAGTVVITARTTDGSDLSATCSLTVTAAGSGGDGPGGGNTAVEEPDALQAVRVYADGGRIEVRGLPLGTAVTLSGVDGRLWYQTEAVTGPELTLSAPRGHVYVLRLNHTHSFKVYLP